jgi:hypothetical protein
MKKKELRILFLDIDGVCNSYQSHLTLGDSMFEHTNFDPIAVRLLFKVCLECDLTLVIHSTWSRECDTKFFKKSFKEYETDEIKMPEILDYQTRSVYWERNRVQRIQNNYSHYKPAKWVVVDDEYIEDYIEKTNMKNGLVVKTDHAVGFTYYDYGKILGFFGKKMPLILI